MRAVFDRVLLQRPANALAARNGIEGSGEIAGIEVGGPSVPVFIWSIDAVPGSVGRTWWIWAEKLIDLSRDLAQTRHGLTVGPTSRIVWPEPFPYEDHSNSRCCRAHSIADAQLGHIV